ncbi:unnamed protein product, partial [Vitis vinifera]|uniref:Uncharacterized protein n=1 Tax=Vitis vinifera TaxID=29760 RepID=D7SRG3_VITVI
MTSLQVHSSKRAMKYEKLLVRSQVIWIPDNQEQKFPIDGIDKIRFQVQSVSYSPVPIEQRKESKPFASMVISLCYIVGIFYNTSFGTMPPFFFSH